MEAKKISPIVPVDSTQPKFTAEQKYAYKLGLLKAIRMARHEIVNCNDKGELLVRLDDELTRLKKQIYG